MRTTVTSYTIPQGDRGSYATLRTMKRIVGEAMRDVPVLDAAKDLIRLSGGTNRLAQAQAIQEWMTDHVNFCRDPYGIETIHTPLFMLSRIREQGMFEADCDDYAVLSAALAKAVGMRTKFVVLGFFGKKVPYAHVYTMAQTEEGWMPFDRSFGLPPGSITRRAYYEV